MSKAGIGVSLRCVPWYHVYQVWVMSKAGIGVSLPALPVGAQCSKCTHDAAHAMVQQPGVTVSLEARKWGQERRGDVARVDDGLPSPSG